MSRKNIGFILLMATALALIVVITLPRQAAAQCGAAASSCKDCHEVKKLAPVNTNGSWHTAHAFGDFCEFCHSGNTKAKEKEAAHVGMVYPLSDIKAACQSCHPNDFNDRAQKYSTALGKPIGYTGKDTPAAGTTSSTSSSVAPVASTVNCPPVPPVGGQAIDLNKVYADAITPPADNTGNMILAGLVIALVLILLALMWFFDKPLARVTNAFRQLMFGSAAEADSEKLSPEVNALLPLLQSTDSATLRAIKNLLADKKNAPKLLSALSKTDLASLSALSEGDEKTLSALLTLAREMKA